MRNEKDIPIFLIFVVFTVVLTVIPLIFALGRLFLSFF